MAFGMLNPFFSTSVFDDPFFYEPAWPTYRRPSFWSPRRARVSECAVHGRCGPWRSVRRYEPSPSVFDLLNFGNELSSFWDDWENTATALLTNEPATTATGIEDKPAQREAPKIAAPSTSEEKSTASMETDVASSSSPTESNNTTVAEVPARPAHFLGEVHTKALENGTAFEIHLPGLSREDVKLDLDFKRHALTVKAEKKVEEKKEDTYGKRTTYRHVSVARMLPVPAEVKPEDIKADFVDGVLHIKVKHKAISAPEPEVASLQISAPTSEESTTNTGSNATSESSNTEAETATSSSMEGVSAESSPATAESSPAEAAPTSSVTVSPPSENSDEASVEDAEEN